jgi:hypothetical protein
MGRDSIGLLVAIEKRPNFLTQRDRKIQDSIDGNSLGNCWLARSQEAGSQNLQSAKL